MRACVAGWLLDRDQRGADAVAVGDRRQTGHVATERVREYGRLRLAQRRERDRGVGHGAGMLTQLDRIRAHRMHGDRVASIVQACRDGLHRDRLGIITASIAAIPVPKVGGSPFPGECRDALLACGLAQEVQRMKREPVVGLPEGCATGVGEAEDLTRAPTAAGGAWAERWPLPRCHQAGVHQGGHRAPDRGWGQVKATRELGRRCGSGRQQRASDPLSSHSGEFRNFHDAILAEFPTMASRGPAEHP